VHDFRINPHNMPLQNDSDKLHREDYPAHVWTLLLPALGDYFRARITQTVGCEDVDPLWDNEVRRLIDLQLPHYILIARTDGQFSRADAIEETITRLEGIATRVWTNMVRRVARGIAADPSSLRLPDCNGPRFSPLFETRFLRLSPGSKAASARRCRRAT
jgi:hypothetical protein